MLRFASMAACLVLAAPMALMAQTGSEDDGAVNLDAIDALLGGDRVTSRGEAVAAPVDDEAEFSDDSISDEDADEDAMTDDEAAEDDEDAPELSDLTIAFNGYSLCASEAGAALEETGFALDVIGREALLRCSGQRAAYVNAFFFSLVPHYPDASEAEIRASAERLVAQSDRAISSVVTREVTDLREIRELDAASDTEDEDTMPADPADDEAAADDEETPDGETAEDEMEPDA